MRTFVLTCALLFSAAPAAFAGSNLIKDGGFEHPKPPPDGVTAHAASKLQVLTSFGKSMGASPYAAPVADAAGNLYIATVGGGVHAYGVVIELSPPAAGQTAWAKTVLHAFDGVHGRYPYSGVVIDTTGNLYGATGSGGANNCGVVYELSPPMAGKSAWKETTLFTFKTTDGCVPFGPLIADRAGNLYGTTTQGGSGNNCGDAGCGVVFELSPPAPGRTSWNEIVLHSFNQTDGGDPIGRLMVDGEGNVFGTTAEGGPHQCGEFTCGVVFELSPPALGKTEWTETVLHSFDGADGIESTAGLIADGSGNLYGTVEGGGEFDGGVVFELTPPAAGKKAWKETVLHTFKANDGTDPNSSLIWGGTGDLYGVAGFGKAHDAGVIFELSPPALGQAHWTERVVHVFNGRRGGLPFGGLIADGFGNFYGATVNGGKRGDGIVFKFTP